MTFRIEILYGVRNPRVGPDLVETFGFVSVLPCQSIQDGNTLIQDVALLVCPQWKIAGWGSRLFGGPLSKCNEFLFERDASVVEKHPYGLSSSVAREVG